MPERQTKPHARLEMASDGGVEHNGVETKPRAEAPADHAKSNGAATGAPVEANYQYWRDHGGEWADAYDHRKKRQVLYHIQELMITQYILEHAVSAPTKPLKVLELGCGVGRHLRNLTRLPDVDAYGYDQSPTMAGCILRWAGKQWFDSHITVGSPTGVLPYPDKHFDIVYTAEVLIHVRPEHVDGILAELVRVCRGHIFHMENSEHHKLVADCHNGCWMHDMVAAYARLGLSCQVLPSGYFAHTPYRVIVGQEPRFTWAPAILEMYRRLERDMDEGFAAVQAEARQQAQGTQESVLAQHARDLEAAGRTIQELTGTAAAQTARADALSAQLAEAQARSEATCAGLKAELDTHTARAEALAVQLAEASAAEARAAATSAGLKAELDASSARADDLAARLAEASAAEGSLAALCGSLKGELEASTARTESLASQLVEARGGTARQGAVCADLRKEADSLAARTAELEGLWNSERTQARALAEQRRTFVSEISRYLRP
jgi:SAM-dependent methyltransferase